MKRFVLTVAAIVPLVVAGAMISMPAMADDLPDSNAGEVIGQDAPPAGSSSSGEAAGSATGQNQRATVEFVNRWETTETEEQDAGICFYFRRQRSCTVTLWQNYLDGVPTTQWTARSCRRWGSWARQCKDRCCACRYFRPGGKITYTTLTRGSCYSTGGTCIT